MRQNQANLTNSEQIKENQPMFCAVLTLYDYSAKIEKR